MSDITHFFGNDLSTDETGDLAVSGGDDQTTQRVLRRLLTAPLTKALNGQTGLPPDYLWEPDYGAGLRRMIGKAIQNAEIVGVINSQLFYESGVSQRPAPAIDVEVQTGGVTNVNIEYTSSSSGTPMLLDFDVPVGS